MPLNQPNPADEPNLVDQIDGEQPIETDEDRLNLGMPSLEDVVERLERVRPEALSAVRRSVQDLAGQQIGRYKIQRIVGRGAFGIVYQARDEQLGRDVAIKVPRPEVLFDEDKLRRFESEAATAATLDHPAIIPIYEADLSGPTPYIASAYCVGPNLGEWLANCVERVPSEQAATFVIKLAEAVHYAHQEGVLHRDLKPGNVMLEPCQQVGLGGKQLENFEPRLTDFGLAKLLDNEGQDTRSSIMLGTPRYMAPEQFDKRLGSVGVQSDVYALGTILYELLAGQPAIEGGSHMELLLSILEREATPPSRLQASVSPTLEAICLKALEKRPHARYATALEMAEDLGRYLRGEPTHAKPLGLPSRAAKWIRLNSWAASLLAVISLSLVGLLIGISWHNYRLSDQLAVSNRLRSESLRARYVSDMQLTQQAIAGGKFSEAGSRLARYQPGSDGAEVSDLAWHLLSSQLDKTLVDFKFKGPLRSLAVSDKLKVSATGGEDGMLRFFDNTSGAQLATTKAHEGNINTIAFAADGTTLVSGGDDGMLCVWDTTLLRDSGKIKLSRSCKAHEGDLLCVAVSPDSKWIASGSADNSVRLWNFKDLEPAGDLLGHTDWVRALDFSPDSASLFSGGHDTTIRRWDLETHNEVDRYFEDDLIEEKECVYSLKHHPAEPLIIAGYKDYSIRFWDTSTGKQQQKKVAGFNGWVRSLSISADGNLLAACADDSRIMVFERDADRQYKLAKQSFTDRSKNFGIAFTNSDSQVVSAGNEGASIWLPDSEISGEAVFSIHGNPQNLDCISYMPDMNSVVMVASPITYTISLLDGSHQENDLLFHDASISTDGSLIAYIRDNYTEEEPEACPRVRVRRRGERRSQQLFTSGFKYNGVAYYGVDISPSGIFVAAAMPDGMIRIWKGPHFELETTIQNPSDSDFDNLLIDDTGSTLFLQTSFGHEMTVFDIATSKTIAVLRDIEEILNRNSDESRLLISRSDLSVSIYDSHHYEVVQTIPNHTDEVIGACFSPAQPLVATITSRGKIALWDEGTGGLLVRFPAECDRKIDDVYLTFTSDGQSLIVGIETGDGIELRVWRLP